MLFCVNFSRTYRSNKINEFMQEKVIYFYEAMSGIRIAILKITNGVRE